MRVHALFLPLPPPCSAATNPPLPALFAQHLSPSHQTLPACSDSSTWLSNGLNPVCYTHLWWTERLFEWSPFFFVLALYLCATLIAETFWDAFWIAYEPCGRVCAGGLLFSQFSLKNYPVSVNTSVIIKLLKCCQSFLRFEMPKIFLFTLFVPTRQWQTHCRLILNKTPPCFGIYLCIIYLLFEIVLWD